MSFAMTRYGRLLALAALTVGVAAGQGLTVGEKAPDFSFSGVMLNGDGRTDLKEFRGNVLMLDWWGNH